MQGRISQQASLIGAVKSLPIEGVQVAHFASRAATLLEKNLDKVREMLKKEASDLCKSAEDTPLPPLRAINHRTPLKDESIISQRLILEHLAHRTFRTHHECSQRSLQTSHRKECSSVSCIQKPVQSSAVAKHPPTSIPKTSGTSSITNIHALMSLFPMPSKKIITNQHALLVS
ncbi:10405_t:CDS:2 [Acaulospora colombiana]|uniref:10405_t:CDS:1 n=1 Tax=Acaulospora colombiana TaxID=27376 RepID=A0ACA9PWM0_9GLOM|nr:10405_t:CDS:2 [Acaulospora colombiana]